MRPRPGICLAALLIGTSLVTAAGTAPRSEPARTVKIVVPFPPGGAADILARLLADQIARLGSGTIQIEN